MIDIQITKKQLLALKSGIEVIVKNKSGAVALIPHQAPMVNRHSATDITSEFTTDIHLSRQSIDMLETTKEHRVEIFNIMLQPE